MTIQKGIEIRVGLFVVSGMILIMLAVILLGGGTSLFSRTINYSSHFENAEGLIPGAKVILSGINVGSVDKVEFDKDLGNVKVTLSVSKNVKDWIREDTTAEIATQGVLGDKYITLKAGSPNKPLLEINSDIFSKPTKDISQFINKGDQLLITLNRIASNLDRIFSAFETDNRSEQFFKNMTSTSKNLSITTEKIGQELNNIRLKSSVAHLDQILEKLDSGTGTIGALINDPSLYDEIKSLLGGANRSRIIRNLVRQTLKSSQGQGGTPAGEPQGKGSGAVPCSPA
jgi:phospholipid/cholesterol/gamma-HCH transport system substrate-binding protein